MSNLRSFIYLDSWNLIKLHIFKNIFLRNTEPKAPVAGWLNASICFSCTYVLIHNFCGIYRMWSAAKRNSPLPPGTGVVQIWMIEFSTICSMNYSFRNHAPVIVMARMYRKFRAILARSGTSLSSPLDYNTHTVYVGYVGMNLAWQYPYNMVWYSHKWYDYCLRKCWHDSCFPLYIRAREDSGKSSPRTTNPLAICLGLVYACCIGQRSLIE